MICTKSLAAVAILSILILIAPVIPWSTCGMATGTGAVERAGEDAHNRTSDPVGLLNTSAINQTNASSNSSIGPDALRAAASGPSSGLWSWGGRPKYNSSQDGEENYLEDPAFVL